MRTAFIECKSRTTAKRKCPWASATMKVEGGFFCYESVADYAIAKNQK